MFNLRWYGILLQWLNRSRFSNYESNLFMRSAIIPRTIREFLNTVTSSKTCEAVAQLYRENLETAPPAVSVVIPAYNEEKNIIPTLLSLVNNDPGFGVEIIVVNNNSSDNTESLVKACGMVCINETTQGIKYARNTGLVRAKGEYILNADADTIYPSNWIAEMIKPLTGKEKVALTYGRFSFIPVGNTSRFGYFFYEYASGFVRLINKHFREEAVNVYGFSSGFRREEGLAVDGFDHPPGAGEDGWLGLKLRNKGFGKLYYVTSSTAWTTDRRIQIDGGMRQGILKRIKRNLRSFS